MENIKLNSGVKKIQVNEKGEYITFPMNNQEFVNKVYKIFSDLQSEETMKMADEVDKEENIGKKLEIMNAFTTKFLNAIDELFGQGSCKKIFSEIYEYDEAAIPDVLAITDFFEQLIPLVEKFGKERNKALNEKYNHYRKGARK